MKIFSTIRQQPSHPTAKQAAHGPAAVLGAAALFGLTIAAIASNGDAAARLDAAAPAARGSLTAPDPGQFGRGEQRGRGRRLEPTSAGTTWERLPGTATDIGVGADGSAWVIGTNPSGRDFGIHRWTGSSWEAVDGEGLRIDVDPRGNPWIVNSNDEVYRRVNGQWEKLPGLAKDIGVGADGTAWVIGTNPVSGTDRGVHRWNGTAWEPFEGSGVRIDVDATGNPWIVNTAEQVYRRVDNEWMRMPGSAKDIGVGGPGSFWVVGTNRAARSNDFLVYRWGGNDWEGIDGGAVQISVDGQGMPWVVSGSGAILRRR